MTTVDRALSVLRLFTTDRPDWSVEAAARELGLSQSTAYQYFRSLVNGGLLSTVRIGRYVIGPAVIELDRHTRRTDPLLLAAQAPLDSLCRFLASEGMVLLCRLYQSTVMCVDQRSAHRPSFAVSYERGRPMPLSRGSASKVIFAHLPRRVLKRYYDETLAAPSGGPPAPSWLALAESLRDIRRAGFCVTYGELDPGVVGVSAPVFSPEGEILGSIGVVLAAADLADGAPPKSVTDRVVKAGRQVSLALRAAGGAVLESAATIDPGREKAAVAP